MAVMSESELERELHRRGQELVRKLLQGHHDQRSPGQAAGPAEDASGVECSARREQDSHAETTSGTMQVVGLGCARRGHDGLHPLDAALNLLPERSLVDMRRRVTIATASRAPPRTPWKPQWYSTLSTWQRRDAACGARRQLIEGLSAFGPRPGGSRPAHGDTWLQLRRSSSRHGPLAHCCVLRPSTKRASTSGTPPAVADGTSTIGHRSPPLLPHRAVTDPIAFCLAAAETDSAADEEEPHPPDAGVGYVRRRYGKERHEMDQDLKKLMESSEFKQYHQAVQNPPFNLFDVLRHADYEIRHSNVLEWLLDPGGTHGTASKFLQGFIRCLNHHADVAEIKRIPVPASFEKDNVSVERELHFADIAVLFKKERRWMIIENKTVERSRKHYEQVKSYERDFRKRYKGQYTDVRSVLLTTSSEGDASEQRVIHLGWSDVQALIKRCP